MEKSSGRVCVADSSNNCIMVYSSIDSGFSVQQIQTASFQMALPPHAILENGRVTCLDFYNRILRYNSTLSNTSLHTQFGTLRTQQGIFAGPQSCTFSPDGEFMGAIGEPAIDPIGEYRKYSDGELFLPIGLSVDANHNIIVSDTSHKRVRIFNSDGELIGKFGGMSNTPGNFFSPLGSAVNQNTGRCYVTDGVTQQVSLFDPESTD